MGLPSQTPRTAATGRTFVRTHRKRRWRMGPLAVAAVIVLIGAGGAWWLTRGGGEDGRGALGPSTAVADDRILDDPYARDVVQTPAADPVAQRRPQPAPVEIQQGGSGQAAPVEETGFVLQDPRPLGETLRQSPEIGGAPRETPAPASSPAQTPPPASAGSGAFDRAMQAASARVEAGDPVAARSVLSDALRDPGLSEAERSRVRARLTELNQELIFSPKVVAGDPLTDTYTIESGDSLSRLPNKLGLAIDWRVIQAVNGIDNPNHIRLGQKVKVLRGPFHAVVDKSDYRLDLYAGAPDEPGRWTYIRSFRVGLGEDDSTPTGSFVVRRDSKLINPHWVNPRTGERFDQNDPKNPIGEHWIGLDGVGEDAVKTGYGIHGTIEPGSIGQQKSMGCVRMLDDDVELMYGLLVEGISRVRIEE